MRKSWYNVDSSQRDKRLKQAERVRRKLNRTGAKSFGPFRRGQ
uniref:Uncharacterized protein n=1 Tax=Siphoviridae sp. ctB3v5 TaxID=2826186 RepID=A0A8S5M8V1_9CAUD|nr:MAG TPA: hypothetical protein [Siphoviridae sp. ctB3v5]